MSEIETTLTALYFVDKNEQKLFGLTPTARLQKQFGAHGVTHIVQMHELEHFKGNVIFIRADAILDQPLIGIMIKNPGLMLTSASGHGSRPLAINAQAGHFTKAQALLQNLDRQDDPHPFRACEAQHLQADYWQALRKRETPYALSLADCSRNAAEWRIFIGTYKGATDLVTKYIWPFPAFHVTRWLSAYHIKPNMVTSVGAACMIAAFFAFLYGHYAMGLVVAWLMTFLDTVDGKLARTTMTSSKWGNIFDHGIDLIHPPFWYIAWAIGLETWGFYLNPEFFAAIMMAILGGYIVQRLIEGSALKWLGLEIHIWRPIDSFFRTITARRNPNLLLLTLSMMVSQPVLGLIGVAVWTIICLLIHCLQLAQGFMARRHGPLRSWMAGK